MAYLVDSNGNLTKVKKKKGKYWSIWLQGERSEQEWHPEHKKSNRRLRKTK